jgi:hypothetical protein
VGDDAAGTVHAVVVVLTSVAEISPAPRPGAVLSARISSCTSMMHRRFGIDQLKE